MHEERTADFSLPWCIALFKDPSLQRIPTAFRVIHGSTLANNLLGIELFNERSIPAVQTFIKRRPRPKNVCSPHDHHDIEICMLLSLGRGVEGIAGTAHGGIVALMLDEVMAQLASEIFGRDSIITANLNVEFKRRLDTPRVVLAKAYMEDGGEEVKGGDDRGESRRRLKIRGRIEDGEGGIFAEGTSVFVKLRPKM